MKQRLNAAALKATKPKAKAYKVSDGGGLYLLVTPTGNRLWRYKYRLAGRESTYGIGSFPEMGLAEAREEHRKARQLVSAGVSPVLRRRQDREAARVEAANCFEAIATRWMQEMSTRWSTYYARQVETTMRRDVFPHIGSRPIRDVTASQLRPILLAVASRRDPPDGKRTRDRGAATVAQLIRQWCSSVFIYGVAHGLTEVDPTFALRGLVSRPKVRHHGHMTIAELPQFKKKLAEFTGTSQVRMAIELLMLTFVRTGELRHAEWSEFDLDAGQWRIPAAKMKMGRTHIVPLSSRSREVLRELRELTGHSRYLFPNQKTQGAVMSMTTVNRALERMGYAGRLSGHGFRGTASTALNELGFSSHLIEKQLAHTRKNAVEAAYNHSEHLQKRAEMMQFWSDFIDSGAIASKNVISIATAA